MRQPVLWMTLKASPCDSRATYAHGTIHDTGHAHYSTRSTLYCSATRRIPYTLAVWLHLSLRRDALLCAAYRALPTLVLTWNCVCARACVRRYNIAMTRSQRNAPTPPRWPRCTTTKQWSQTTPGAAGETTISTERGCRPSVQHTTMIVTIIRSLFLIISAMGTPIAPIPYLGTCPWINQLGPPLPCNASGDIISRCPAEGRQRLPPPTQYCCNAWQLAKRSINCCCI